MATQDAQISIPFGIGVNQDADEKILAQPALLRLENGFLDRKGVIRKRPASDVSNFYGFNPTLGGTAQWLSALDNQMLMGTTRGMVCFPSGGTPKRMSTFSTTDAVTKQAAFASFASLIEQDVSTGYPTSYDVVTAVQDDYAITLFVVPMNSGYELRYMVSSVSTREMVRGPFPVYASASFIRSPKIITTPANAVFGFLVGDGQSRAFVVTGSVALSTLANGFPVFTSTTVSSAVSCITDIAIPTSLSATVFPGFGYVTYAAAGSCLAYVVRYNDIGLSTYTASVSRAWVDGAVALTAYYYEGNGRVYLSSVGCRNSTLGTSTPGAGTIRAGYNTYSTLTWFATTRTEVLDGCAENGSWSITANMPGVGDAPIRGDMYRITSGRVNTNSVNAPVIGIWATGFYSGGGNALLDDTIAACTSFYTTSLTLGALDRRTPLWNYALCTNAIYIPAYNASGVGVYRSGTFNLPNTRYQTNLDETTYGFLCVPSFENAYVHTPVAQFAENDLPNRAWTTRAAGGVIVGKGGSTFSLGTWFTPTDPKSVARNRVSLLLRTNNNPRFVDVDITPEPGRRITEGGLSIGRGTCDYYDAALPSEMTPLAAAFGYSGWVIEGDPNPILPKYVVVYVDEDAKGNVHRSQPSLPFGATYRRAGEVNNDVLLVGDVPVSGLVDPLSRDTVFRSIEIYKVPSGTTMYVRVFRGDPRRMTRNIYFPNMFELELPPALYDVTRPLNTIPLYTTGGVLEAQPSPSLLDVTLSRGRLWGLSDQRLYYTKPLLPKVAPEWNFALSVPIPEDCGKANAIAAMDDKVVVFCDTGVYVVYGEGANSVGTGQTLAEPMRIPGGVGSRFYGSIVECPQGIAFLSDAGFFLLDRGLNFKFIGASVITESEALLASYTAWGVKHAVHDVQNECIRWFTDGSFAFAWFYNIEQWSLLSQANEQHALNTPSGLQLLVPGSNSATTYLETPRVSGQYCSTSPLLRARTGWISLGQLAGYIRTKAIALNFTRGVNSAGAVSPFAVVLYNDYNSTTFSSLHAYLGPVADPLGRSVFEVTPKNQKAEAVSVEIIEAPIPVPGQGQDVGNGFKLQGLTLTVGGKRGVFKPMGSGWRA